MYPYVQLGGDDISSLDTVFCKSFNLSRESLKVASSGSV